VAKKGNFAGGSRGLRLKATVSEVLHDKSSYFLREAGHSRKIGAVCRQSVLAVKGECRGGRGVCVEGAFAFGSGSNRGTPVDVEMQVEIEGRSIQAVEGGDSTGKGGKKALAWGRRWYSALSSRDLHLLLEGKYLGRVPICKGKGGVHYFHQVNFPNSRGKNAYIPNFFLPQIRSLKESLTSLGKKFPGLLGSLFLPSGPRPFSKKGFGDNRKIRRMGGRLTTQRRMEKKERPKLFEKKIEPTIKRPASEGATSVDQRIRQKESSSQEAS